MHSKHKGTLAETKVTADLYEKGISVAIVVDDLLPIDLIAIKENKLYKVQVKYCRFKKHNRTKTETLVLELRNSMSNKTLIYKKHYTKKEVDIFAIYVPELDKCLYIKSDILDTHSNTFTLRSIDIKNGQTKGCNFIENYLEFTD